MATFVQKALTSDGTAATTIVVSFSAAGAGNFITGLFSWGSTDITGLTAGSTTTVIKDNNNVNAFVVDVAAEPGGPVATVMYRFANISGTVTSITCTIPGGSTGQRLGTMQEWSGIATSSPEDGHALASAASSTTQTSPSITTGSAGDLLVGYLGGNFTGTSPILSASFSAAGTGSTIRNLDATNSLGADSSEIQTAAGASTASFLLQTNPQQYQTGIAAFKVTAAAASQTPYQPYFQQMVASKRKSMIGWREGYDHRWRRWRRERGLIVPNNRLIRRAA